MRGYPLGRREGAWRPATVRAAPVQYEEGEQMAFIHWCEVYKAQYPLLGRIHHSPNGGWRAKKTARKLKRMGVRPGFLDLFLPVSKRENGQVVSCGLVIEMKWGDNELSEDQEDWFDFLRREHECKVAYNWREAVGFVVDYLCLPDRLRIS